MSTAFIVTSPNALFNRRIRPPSSLEQPAVYVRVFKGRLNFGQCRWGPSLNRQSMAHKRLSVRSKTFRHHPHNSEKVDATTEYVGSPESEAHLQIADAVREYGENGRSCWATNRSDVTLRSKAINSFETRLSWWRHYITPSVLRYCQYTFTQANPFLYLRTTRTANAVSHRRLICSVH